MSDHFLHDLRTSFEMHAARPAIEHRGRAITYAQLDETARRCAGWLQSLCVGPGDRVAVVTEQKLPLLLAHLGALFAGAAPLPLNPRYTREELRYFLSDSQPRVVVAGAEPLQVIESLAAEWAEPGDAPVVVSDATTLDPPQATFREPRVEPDGMCLMMYTSGTTGWPKGAVHTHANVARSLQALARCWQMSAEDRVANALPLFHIHGLAFATHLTWLAGGCVLIEDAFEPTAMLDCIGRSTVFMAVPTIYYRLLEEPSFAAAAGAWKQARLFTCGSAPIRAEVLPKLEGILGRGVVNRYGMTEAYVITSLNVGGPWPAGSVGLALEGIELPVVDEQGASVAAGESGQVVVRGPNLFREYWRKPEATAAAFVDGWFQTGDVGTLDAAGYLTLLGRQDDMIITAGFNVYPQVVERVIGECPGVRECAVIGLSDEQRGQQVAAAVVCDTGTLDMATLRAWIDERLIHYQRPRTIVLVDALPRNSMGKVLRRSLREQLETAAHG